MQVAITGLSGFIARHLAPELARRKVDVVGFGRQPVGNVLGRYVQGDLLDTAFVASMVGEADVVVHLASTTQYAELTHDRMGSFETIVTGTRNVLEALRLKRGPKKLIYASTGKVYGRIRSLPLTEDHMADPMNVLGKAKFIAERLIDYYASELDAATILRIFNVYGPDQHSQFLIPTIISQLGNAEIVLGDIKAKRDYIYIEDVVSAIQAVLELPASKTPVSFNVCSGVASSAEEIVRTIGEIQGREMKLRSKTDMIRHDEFMEEYGSYARLQAATGWKPRYDLRAGLKKTLGDGG